MPRPTKEILAIALAFLSLPAAFAASSKETAPSRPSVILITMDTLRADHVGCYGAKAVETPTLDALAHDGVVFEHAIAQVPLTWPSHAAILTGTYPFQNGVQDFTGHPLEPRFRSVAQSFKQAGYATGAVVSSFVLDRSWGLARGFDFYDDSFPAASFQQRDLGLVDRKAKDSVTHALAWLDKTPHRPFFLWLHLYDPHSPYDPPEPYRTRYRDHLYGGEIAYADHELGRLIAWLKASHLYDQSLIVFLSDHGESLGEHGEDEHGFFVYNATLHVPLIVKPPAGRGVRAERRPKPVETTAVAPSMLQIAGVKDSAIQSQFQSGSLFETNPPKQAPAYSETFYPFSSFGWSPLHSLETERFHYIEAPTMELYDLESDPSETRNVATLEPATLAVLKEELHELLTHNPFSSKETGAPSLSPDAQEKLRALGYFGFRASVSEEALAAGLPDPKDKISEFSTILKAQDAFHQQDDEHAEALLLQVQKQDPKIYVIPYLLAESSVRHQNWARAVDEFQRCLELNPGFDNAMTGLAHALAKLGRVEEARNWLQRTLEANPANYRAWYEIGLLQAGRDPAAALSSYEKAIAIQPNFSPGQRELGMALYQRKNYASAALHFEKAIALGLDDAHLRNFLGICYSQTNRAQKSIASYREALKLDPNLAEAHLNLGYELQRAGKITQAGDEYQAACRLDAKFCAAAPN
jgi:arylsulfatase A-like enzyme/Flp pilus assembly protein TadD